MAVVIRLAAALSPEMDELRCQGFLDPNSGISTLANPFDASSTQLSAHSDSGELVGIARLTPGDQFMLEAWTHGLYPAPATPFVDVSRIVVKGGWRGLGLYKLLVSLALVEAHKQGASKVRMVIDVGLPAQSFLGTIGFTIEASNILSYDIPALPPVPVDCVTIDLAANMPTILSIRDSVLRRLNGP